MEDGDGSIQEELFGMLSKSCLFDLNWDWECQRRAIKWPGQELDVGASFRGETGTCPRFSWSCVEGKCDIYSESFVQQLEQGRIDVGKGRQCQKGIFNYFRYNQRKFLELRFCVY